MGSPAASFPVALPAMTPHETGCSTCRVDAENVVVVSRREVEDDVGRRVERHAGTCLNVEAAADPLAAGAALASVPPSAALATIHVVSIEAVVVPST